MVTGLIPAIRAGDARDLFALDLDELAQVQVTTASKKASRLQSAPASLTVIDAEQIRRAGWRNLFALLETVPGFTGLNGINAGRSMVVRGMASDNGVLVLLDGTPVNDPFSGNFNFFELALSAFERIEIIRGPGSALYGGNALVGVVNLISRKATPQLLSTRWRGGYGEHDSQEADLQWQWDMSDWLSRTRVAGGVSWQQSDGDERFIFRDRMYTPQPARYLPPLTNPTLTPTTRQETTETLSSYFNLDFYDWQARYHYAHQRITPLFSVRGVVTEPGDTLRVDALNTLTISHSEFGNDTLQWAPKFYYSLHQSKFLGDSEPPQIQGDDNQDGLNEAFISGIIESFEHDAIHYGGSIEWHWQFAQRQRLSMEWNGERAYLDRAQKLSNATLIGRAPIYLFPVQDVTDEFITTDSDRRLNALSVEYFWQMADAWSFTLGGRHSRYSDFGKSTDPRLGLVYEDPTGWYSKLLYGSAFVPPSFIQLFDQSPTLTRFRRRGNPDLKASSIRTLEWLNGITFSPRLNGEITLFQSQTDNEIFYNSAAGTERWQNGDSRSARGLELSSTWRPEQAWQLRTALTVQNSEGIETGIAADIHPHVRTHLGAYWTPGNDHEWFVGINYFSSPNREKNDPRARLAAKTHVDLNWRWRDLLPGADFSVTVYNLLDKTSADETNYALGITDDMPRSARQYWLSLQYRWP